MNITFKTRNLKMFWKHLRAEWISDLCGKNNETDFLAKFKLGELLYYKYLKTRFVLTKKPSIPLMDYMITTRCTLNCKNCNTKIPEFNKNKTHVQITTFEQFKKDIDIFLKSVDFIKILFLVGGEPTLAPELDKIIAYATSKKQIHHVFLATNCTILPDEKLIKVMKNKKFAVQISDYSHVKNITTGVTVKYDEYKKILKKNGIKFNNFQEKNNAQTWRSMPEVYKDSRDKETLEKIYNSCFSLSCNMLCEGKFLLCTIASYIAQNLELTPEVKNEIVDIRNIKSSKDITNKLINFYSKPFNYFCGYCHHENIQSGLPCGEQVEN